MIYHSTRDRGLRCSAAQAVLTGLAPDGGLYVPEALPAFDWEKCLAGCPLEMSAAIASAMLPDIPDMEALAARAYGGKFTHPALTPTVPVGHRFVLELFHGPTAAFKDVALCMLPQLLTAARQVLGERRPVKILTATSGDTGKAALEGFRDVEGVQICVFYPYGGVSQVQRAQMVTQEGSNVQVCAVRGDFDDAQTGVKQIFSACQGQDLGCRLSSANSINIGRLVPQIMYYFKAYRDLMDQGAVRLGEPVDFSVPTGNFGDILAGYLAKALGLPVGRLVCASNANKVLTDFFRTGVYDRRRPLYKTTSPSMDILVSSNLERLLYFMTQDPDQVAGWMADLSATGRYQIGEALLKRLQEQFPAHWCDDAAAAAAIGQVWRDHGYLMDPHTAAAWTAAQRHQGDRPMVVLSTASAYKFPAAVLTALGEDPIGDGFDQMDRLHQITGTPVPPGLSGLRWKPERHLDVIDKEQMLAYALGR